MEPKEMKSEDDLLKLIFGDAKDFKQAFYQKMKELNNNQIKSSIVKIISMTYSSGKLDFGKYLSNYKSDIINHLYDCYSNEANYTNFLFYLSQIEMHNVILKFFKEVEEFKSNIAYDFFKIHLKEDCIEDILNKYFIKKIKKMLRINGGIKNINELITLIKDSKSLSNEKCDFNVLFIYIMQNYLKKKQISNSNNIDNTQNMHINNNDSSMISEIAKKIDNSKLIQETPVKINISLNINSNELKNQESDTESINIINNKKENDDKTQEVVETIETNIIKNYFQLRKDYYSKKGYETPILDKILEGTIEIKKNIFLIEEPKKKYLIEPYYYNLNILINIFSIPKKFQEYVINKKKFGYFCYEIKNDKKYVYQEGIYGILDNAVLFTEITNKKKFEKDEFENCDKNIVDNAFKARGLALEYYINGIFMELLEQDELPRVIYNFAPLKEIEEKEEVEQESKEEIEQEIDEEHKEESKVENKVEDEIKEENKRDREIEEIDGVFYTKEDYEIDIRTLPFIIDDIAEIDDLQSPNFDFYAESDDIIKIEKNTLILLEIKNKFPEPEDFEYQIRKVCNKTFSFFQLYEERYENIKKIKIMFFYDAVPKKNYEDRLLRILESIYGNNEIKNKIQFQFIFITSSYLAVNFRNLKDIIYTLENKITDLNKKFESKIEKLESKLDKLLSLFDGTSINREKIDSVIEENINLKAENVKLTIRNEELEKIVSINNNYNKKISKK